jgi:hypothetical protein
MNIIIILIKSDRSSAHAWEYENLTTFTHNDIIKYIGSPAAGCKILTVINQHFKFLVVVVIKGVKF